MWNDCIFCKNPLVELSSRSKRVKVLKCDCNFYYRLVFHRDYNNSHYNLFFEQFNIGKFQIVRQVNVYDNKLFIANSVGNIIKDVILPYDNALQLSEKRILNCLILQ